MDSRVAVAIEHWAPRFIANGVDQSDFVRVTGYVKLDEYEAQDGSKRRSATIVARKVEKVERTEAHAELDAQPA